MIQGIGADIVEVARMRRALARHGAEFAGRILIADELVGMSAAPDAARFLAKRFAAKEAFAKAFSTGLRAPVTLHAVGVANDALGCPFFVFDATLGALMAQRALRAFLSISDEKAYVVAMVVIEGV